MQQYWCDLGMYSALVLVWSSLLVAYGQSQVVECNEVPDGSNCQILPTCNHKGGKARQNHAHPPACPPALRKHDRGQGKRRSEGVPVLRHGRAYACPIGKGFAHV